MTKLTFPNVFSWKHDFLENKLQHISNRNVMQNDFSKEQTKVASLDATIAHNTNQQKITTISTAAMNATTNSEAANPALLLANTGLEATFPMTHVCSSPINNSARLLSPMRKALIPYMTARFDKSSLHDHALPIHGLLPENTLHINHTREATQAKYGKTTTNLAETSLTTESSYTTQNLQTDLMESNKERLGRTGY